jgi:hypothetical protein
MEYNSTEQNRIKLNVEFTLHGCSRVRRLTSAFGEVYILRSLSLDLCIFQFLVTYSPPR